MPTFRSGNRSAAQSAGMSARAARALIPALRAEDLLPDKKVGIRAQLVDRETGTLEMDFVIEHGERSTHILNAVSPAFTCAFPFGEMVVGEIVKLET